MKYIKLYHTISLSAILALTPVALTSCDDDTDPTPIASTSQLTSGAVTYNSLSFTWEPVDNAVQYGCQLTDANGEAVDAKVTKSTSVTFTGLEAATTYTLNVWAYAAVGGPYATSEPVTITATTTALSQLAAPHVAIDNRAGTVTASWNAVEGATSYQVTLALDGETLSSSEETGTSYSWSGLEKGNYIVTVRAISTIAGYEPISAPAQATFVIDRAEIWRAEGTYTRATDGAKWGATLVAYSDDTYQLLNWYNGGTSLDFSFDPAVDEEERFALIGDYEYDYNTGAYYVPTGLASPATVPVYTWYGYSNLTGDRKSGEISLYIYDTNSFDIFTWDTSAAGITADDLAGTWSSVQTGLEYDWDTDSWPDFNYSQSVTVTKIDDKTVSFDGIIWSGYTLVGTIDSASRTITIKPQEWGYYTFGAEDDVNGSVVATIEDNGNIRLAGFTAWYMGYTYYYDTEVIMSR